MVNIEKVLESDSRLTTRLKRQEYESFVALVVRLRSSRSKVIRQLIREAVGASTEDFIGKFTVLEEVGRQLAAAGRNLNQLVRHLNSGKIAGADPLLKVVMDVKTHTDRLDEELKLVVARSRNRWIPRRA